MISAMFFLSSAVVFAAVCLYGGLLMIAEAINNLRYAIQKRDA